jgi:hypothetical protein
MRLCLALTVLLLAAPAQAGSLSLVEAQKIEYLITAIESLQDAQFIRNGIGYDSKAAAEHLRSKLRVAGPRVSTADDFIRLCASASSVSGTPYQIRFGDGHTVTSEAYLRQKLEAFSPKR